MEDGANVKRSVAISDLEAQLIDIRHDFVNKLWRTLGILALLGVPLSVSRALFTGWLPLYGLHIALGLSIAAMVACEERLPYSFKAGLLMVMLWAIGLPDLLCFGLAAPSIWFLVLSCLIASAVYSARAGIAVAVAALSVLGIAAFGFINGWLTPAADANVYLVQPSSVAVLLIATAAFVFSRHHRQCHAARHQARHGRRIRRLPGQAAGRAALPGGGRRATGLMRLRFSRSTAEPETRYKWLT